MCIFFAYVTCILAYVTHVVCAHVTPILCKCPRWGVVAPFPPIVRQNIFTIRFWNVNSKPEKLYTTIILCIATNIITIIKRIAHDNKASCVTDVLYHVGEFTFASTCAAGDCPTTLGFLVGTSKAYNIRTKN